MDWKQLLNFSQIRSVEMDWKRLLNFKQDEVLGLDIGSSQVKLIQMRKDNGSYAVTAAGIVDVADGEGNKEHRETNTVKAIRDCLQSTGVQTRLAVCGVSGPEVAVRDFKFPSLPPEEIGGAVLLEAAQVCPFNIETGTVDYQLISYGEDNVSGVLVAATNKVIKSRTELAEKASLICVLMDVDGLALLNCFSKCDSNLRGDSPAKAGAEAGRTIAILNIGGAYANLAIMSDNALPFIRDMAYAGDAMVAQIATEKGVCPETVKGILAGCEDSSQAELETGDSLEKVCQKLIVDVTETLRYYATQGKSAIAEKIFVCGGFALVDGFVELLDRRLPTKAVLWNPLERVRCDAGGRCEDILQKNGPAMAVAAGLAMREI